MAFDSSKLKPSLSAQDWDQLPSGSQQGNAHKAASNHEAGNLWTLTEYYLRYQREPPLSSTNTLRAYERGVIDLVVAWQHLELVNPPSNAAAAWLHGLQEQGIRPGTLRIKLAAAKALYEALRWARVAKINPFEGLDLKTLRSSKTQQPPQYSREEVAKLQALASPTDQLMLLLFLHAALRPAELVSLCWQDIDLDRGVVRVRRHGTGAVRQVRLSRQLRPC